MQVIFSYFPHHRRCRRRRIYATLMYIFLRDHWAVTPADTLKFSPRFHVYLIYQNRLIRSLSLCFRYTASTPVFLQITPVLGALIGVVVALILVAIIIVVVIRLKGSGERDDKDYDDGGLSPGGRRCVAGSGDKASTEPLNKDLNDSVDSLEEKNPDIIPQNNGEEDYQDEERGFERLNNASTLYRRLSPNNAGRNGPYEFSKTVSNFVFVTYFLLSFLFYFLSTIHHEFSVYGMCRNNERYKSNQN